MDNLAGMISDRALKRLKSKYFLGYLPIYLRRERIRFPERTKDLLFGIEEICKEHPFSRVILSKVLTISERRLGLYTYAIAFYGRIYSSGLTDTIARSYSFIRSKFTK